MASIDRIPRTLRTRNRRRNVKILMVLTSHDTWLKTGFWLEEFAAPYFVFRDAEGIGFALK
jgi:hypothetical protein